MCFQFEMQENDFDMQLFQFTQFCTLLLSYTVLNCQSKFVCIVCICIVCIVPCNRGVKDVGKFRAKLMPSNTICSLVPDTPLLRECCLSIL